MNRPIKQMRRFWIIGSLAFGLAVTSAWTPPVLCRFSASARNFHHYFNDLKQADETLSPWQRLVFSLVLANGHPRAQVQRHS